MDLSLLLEKLESVGGGELHRFLDVFGEIAASVLGRELGIEASVLGAEAMRRISVARSRPGPFNDFVRKLRRERGNETETE